MAKFMNMQRCVGLVTGGASGLGKAAAERMARKGMRVVICDLEKSNGKQVATTIGANALFHPTDVTSETDVADALTLAKEKFGPVNTIINCAGIGDAVPTYSNKRGVHPQIIFDQTLQVNVCGTFNVIRQAVAQMRENEPDKETNQRGVIVNTASIAAFEGQMGQAAYAASKAAIVGMTLPIARDCHKLGIRINTVAPGLFATPLLQSLPEKVIQMLESLVVQPKRLGHPDEFARLVQNIIENPYMNGETIRLDGGLRMPP